jgi:hypothetical protein
MNGSFQVEEIRYLHWLSQKINFKKIPDFAFYDQSVYEFCQNSYPEKEYINPQKIVKQESTYNTM